MNIVDRLLKSKNDKIKNANKRKLPYDARAAYLAGVVSLNNAEEFAKQGNKGRGYSPPTYSNVEAVEG